MAKYENRCKHLLAQCKEKNLDAIIVQSQPNMRYLSGFTGDSGCIIISSRSLILLTDFRYTQQAETQSPDFEVKEFAGGGYIRLVEESLKENECKNIGFEDATLLYPEVQAFLNLNSFEWTPISNDIAAVRKIKSADELDLMREAGRITDVTFTHMLDYIKVGMSEIDIALELEFFIRKNGAEGISFNPIVAAGPNGAMPHAIPSTRKIQSGELLTMDFGCMVEGYCSDMTRTIGIGELAHSAKNIYNICLEAQKKVCCEIRAGMLGKDADKIARDIIYRNGFEGAFGHGLGHGVGMEVHEAPNLSRISEDILSIGHVVTIEPGIYKKEIGGVRIEDFGVIGENGFESFVHSPKELICI